MTADFHEYGVADVKLGKSASPVTCAISVVQEDEKPALVALRLKFADFDRGLAGTPKQAREVAAALTAAAAKATQIDLARAAPAKP